MVFWTISNGIILFRVGERGEEREEREEREREFKRKSTRRFNYSLDLYLVLLFVKKVKI